MPEWDTFHGALRNLNLDHYNIASTSPMLNIIPDFRRKRYQLLLIHSSELVHPDLDDDVSIQADQSPETAAGEETYNWFVPWAKENVSTPTKNYPACLQHDTVSPTLQGFVETVTDKHGKKKYAFTAYYKQELERYVTEQLKNSLRDIEASGFGGHKAELMDWASRANMEMKCALYALPPNSSTSRTRLGATRARRGKLTFAPATRSTGTWSTLLCQLHPPLPSMRKCTGC